MPGERKRTERLLEAVRERKERHRERGRPYRVAVAAGGALLIVLGLLLTAPGIPGPGLLVIAVGLGLLSLEFDRAERLLERTILRIDRLADSAATAPAWQRGIVGALAALGALGVIGAALVWEIPFFPG